MATSMLPYFDKTLSPSSFTSGEDVSSTEDQVFESTDLVTQPIPGKTHIDVYQNCLATLGNENNLIATEPGKPGKAREYRPNRTKNSYLCIQCSAIREYVPLSLVPKEDGSLEAQSSRDHADKCVPQDLAKVLSKQQMLQEKYSKKTMDGPKQALWIGYGVKQAKRKLKEDRDKDSNPLEEPDMKSLSSILSQFLASPQVGTPKMAPAKQLKLDPVFSTPLDVATSVLSSVLPITSDWNALNSPSPSPTFRVSVPAESWFIAAAETLSVKYSRKSIYKYWGALQVDMLGDDDIPDLGSNNNDGWVGLSLFLTGREDRTEAVRKVLEEIDTTAPLQQRHLRKLTEKVQCTVLVYQPYRAKLVLGNDPSVVLPFVADTRGSVQAFTETLKHAT